MRKIALIFAMFLVTCIAFSCDKQGNNITERYGWNLKSKDVNSILYGDVETVTVTIFEVDNKFGNESVKDTSEISVYSFNINGDVVNNVGYNKDGDIWYIYSYTYDEYGRCIEEFYNNKSLEKLKEKYGKYEPEKYWFDHEYKNKLRYDNEGNVIEILKYNHNDELTSHTNNIIDNDGNIVETIIFETDELINLGYLYWYEYIKYEKETRIKYLYDANGMCVEKHEYISTNRNNEHDSKEEIHRKFTGQEIIIYIDRDCTGTIKELIEESKTTYSYDNNGRLIETIDKMYENNYNRKIKYNSKGNIIEEYFVSIRDNDTISYSKSLRNYDDKERCVEKTYNDQKTILKYDNKGNIIEVCYYASDGNLQGKQICIYDNMNNIIEIKRYDCAMGVEILEDFIKIDIKYRNNTR